MIDIAGQLAMQEGLGILAAGFDECQMGKGDNNGLLLASLQFSGGFAEAEKFVRVTVEDGFGGFQKAAPVGIHGGSRWVSDIISPVIKRARSSRARHGKWPTSSRALIDQDFSGCFAVVGHRGWFAVVVVRTANHLAQVAA